MDTVLVWVPYYHLAKPLFLLSLFSPIFPPSSLSDSATKLSSAAKEGDGDRTHRSNGAEDGQRRRGCAVVYANLLQPFLSSHESFLDESLDRAQRSLKLVGSEVTGVGSELITNVASNVVCVYFV